MSFVKKQLESRVARKLHAEDIAAGDYLALSSVTYQFPAFCWCPADSTMLPPEQPVRIAFLPADERLPLKVKSVCLPYVLGQLPDGKHEVHDVRLVQFVKLDPVFACAVIRAVEKDNKVSSDDHDKKKRKKKSRKKK